MINQKQILLIASALGMLAVGLGAFGAHALKALLLQNNRVDTYELAVRYHFYHTLALLAIAILMDRLNTRWLGYAAASMLVGIILFSGSLYLLALLNETAFAIATPFGGVFLLMGWGFLFYSGWKKS
jgi:uncharacterized membrane protein YgdD (TMEM256/DUF423 family)